MNNAVIDIVGQIHKHEQELHKTGKDASKEKIINWFFFIGIIAPCLLSIILIITSVIIKSEYVKIAALASLVIAYFSAIAMPVVSIIVYKSSFLKFFTDPLAPQLRNASIAIATTKHFLPLMMRCSKSELELAGLELKTERDALEKRVGLIMGAIDKIGLWPGLISLLVGLIKVYEWLRELKGVGEIKGIDWCLGIASVLLAFYVMGLIAHTSIMRIDRALKLIDLAAAKKKSKTSCGAKTYGA